MNPSCTNYILLSLLKDFYTTNEVPIPADINESAWIDVAKQAAKLGVAPLLYCRLRNSAAPAQVLSTLQRACHTNALRNKMIYETLSQPLRALHAADIPVIVLKGVYLLECVYENIAMRPMQDADILVHEHNIPEVEKILLDLGYDPPEHPRIRGHRESRIVFHREGGASIEVHWILDRPGSPFLIDHEGLWCRAQPVRITDVEVLGLSPEDLLLHICWQAAVNKQFKKGLYPFFDIYAIINRFHDMFDWNAFVVRAEQWHFSNCAYVSLALARDFFHADVPAVVFDGLRPSGTDPEVLDTAKKLVFAPPALSSNFLQLSSMTSLREKTLLLKRVFFPRRTTIEKKYRLPAGTPKTFFYYPAYWAYLFIKYATFTLRLLRPDRAMKAQITSQQGQDMLLRWIQKNGAVSQQEKKRSNTGVDFKK